MSEKHKGANHDIQDTWPKKKLDSESALKIKKGKMAIKEKALDKTTNLKNLE